MGDKLAPFKPLDIPMKDLLPVQAHPFLAAITVCLQIVLIVFVALLLRSMLHRLIGRVG